MKAIRLQIGRLLDDHCQDCENANAGSKVCEPCPISEKLRQLGSLLGTDKDEQKPKPKSHKRGRPTPPQKITKEEYLGLKEEGLRDSAISTKLSISNYTLYIWKKEWGVKHRLGTERTHCTRGHEFTPENTYIDNKNHKQCKTCKKENNRIVRKRNAQKMWC